MAGFEHGTSCAGSGHSVNWRQSNTILQQTNVNNYPSSIICWDQSLYPESPSITSVTRWVDYLFNIGPFTTMKMSLMALKLCQNRFITLPYTK